MNISKKAIILIFINIIFIGSSGILFSINNNRFRVESVNFYPTLTTDWETLDTSIELYGEIYYPSSFDSERQHPVVILFHGYGRNLNDYYYYVRDLVQLNIVCFSIDFRGFGKSGGEFPTDGKLFNASFGDAMGAYRFIKNKPYINTSQILALGTSLGAGASLFLAIQGVVQNFVLWYPGVQYTLEDKYLYQYDLPTSEVNALIFVGTDDECTRCNPNYVQSFVENNGLEIQWLEGATHTDGRFYSQVSSITKDWIKTLWNLQSPSQLQIWMSQNYFSYALLVFILIFDIIYGIKKRRNRS